VEVVFCNWTFSDTIWVGLCEALRTHPNLQELSLRHHVFGGDVQHRTNALARMMRSNTVLQKLPFFGLAYHRRIFEELVDPRLEMNRSFYADQRITIKTESIAVRPKLLGRALTVVRFNPNLLFLFLSENVDVVATAKGGSIALPSRSVVCLG